MNVYFTTTGCPNTTTFVGTDARFCTTKIHNSINVRNQTVASNVVQLAIVQSCFCVCTRTVHPIDTTLHKFTLRYIALL